MTLKEKIMKLQTYKMFVGEDTVYVERDDVLKLLEQEFREELSNSEIPNKSENPTGSTTKNDLEVDCISRVEALNCLKATELKKFDWIIDAREKISKLSSVTTIRPKGHWIEERNDYGEITHWHCSNCYDDSGFITTCKWDFCPQCGSDNREVEE